MELNPRQLFTLNEMGIPVWELRHETNYYDVETDDLVVNCEDLLIKITACRLIVLTVAPLTNEQEKRLLHAMVFSLGLTPDKLLLISKDEFTSVENRLGEVDSKPLFILGKELAGDWGKGTTDIEKHPATLLQWPVMTSCSLEELLKQTDCKVKVWEDIKSFKSKCAFV
jgi:DNA polymerase III psi subunit